MKLQNLIHILIGILWDRVFAKPASGCPGAGWRLYGIYDGRRDQRA